MIRIRSLLCLMWLCLLASSASMASVPNLLEREVPLPLRAWKEPSFYASARSDRAFEGYRLTWQPNAKSNKASLSVRVIARRDGSALISVRNLNNLQAVGKTRVLTANQVALMRAYLRMADFWASTVESEPKRTQGHVWTIEAAKFGNYRWLQRSAPSDMAFLDAGLYFMRLAGFSRDQFLFKDPVMQWPHG
jgi:hypothetical protein